MSTTALFRGKAADYARYRTDYPDILIRSALESVALVPDDVVADLGAGTGMLSRWFLERGNRVLAVEPDPGMRAVARASLQRFGARHASIAATAERTSLLDSSVTLVVVGNAFHYFDADVARLEVARILRPGGRVLIVGHEHASEPNDFMRAYVDFIADVCPGEIMPFHRAVNLPPAPSRPDGGRSVLDGHTLGAPLPILDDPNFTHDRFIDCHRRDLCDRGKYDRFTLSSQSKYDDSRIASG
jgi:SAM-dependent methyltransferase